MTKLPLLRSSAVACARLVMEASASQCNLYGLAPAPRKKAASHLTA